MTPDQIDRAAEAQAIACGRSSALIGPERLRSLLEMEARQPRLWDAESIKDAPEGHYQTGTRRDDGGANWWGAAGYIDRRFIPRRILARAEKQNRALVFFGPIPHPPEAPKKGGEE